MRLRGTDIRKTTKSVAFLLRLVGPTGTPNSHVYRLAFDHVSLLVGQHPRSKVDMKLQKGVNVMSELRTDRTTCFFVLFARHLHVRI